MLESLWIMRHGLAESEFDSDFNRALSATGAQQVADVCQQLLADEPQLPQTMLVSPFRRTQETAQIVQNKLAMSCPMETDDLLVHFSDHQILGEHLSLKSGRLIVVSHMPIVAKLCTYLVPACDIYGFQTAQIVKLNFTENGAATLAKVYLPKA